MTIPLDLAALRRAAEEAREAASKWWRVAKHGGVLTHEAERLAIASDDATRRLRDLVTPEAILALVGRVDAAEGDDKGLARLLAGLETLSAAARIHGPSKVDPPGSVCQWAERVLGLLTETRLRVEALEREARWIPASEQMPEAGQEVVIVLLSGRRLIARCANGHSERHFEVWRPGVLELWMREDVAWWRPLPAPPGGDGAGGDNEQTKEDA